MNNKFEEIYKLIIMQANGTPAAPATPDASAAPAAAPKKQAPLKIKNLNPQRKKILNRYLNKFARAYMNISDMDKEMVKELIQNKYINENKIPKLDENNNIVEITVEEFFKDNFNIEKGIVLHNNKISTDANFNNFRNAVRKFLLKFNFDEFAVACDIDGKDDIEPPEHFSFYDVYNKQHKDIKWRKGITDITVSGFGNTKKQIDGSEEIKALQDKFNDTIVHQAEAGTFIVHPNSLISFLTKFRPSDSTDSDNHQFTDVQKKKIQEIEDQFNKPEFKKFMEYKN